MMIWINDFNWICVHFSFQKMPPRSSIMIFTCVNNMISNRDWLDLNFQMINTSRQTLFEIQSRAVYKVGNNILTNRLSCLNRKIRLDFLNLSFETYKIKCKNLFLLWNVLIVCFVVYFIIFICSFSNNVIYALMKEQ